MPLFKTIAQIRHKTRELFNTEKIPILPVCLFVCFVVLRPRKHLMSCRDGQLA